ncbi:MAG: DUF3581 family protein [Planctomycetia bacterium]|nr:DUF3581 family protein [Planctomycetia bacterium]MBL6915022.1 DUF3581 family protein [Planctomycetota bacterium]
MIFDSSSNRASNFQSSIGQIFNPITDGKRQRFCQLGDLLSFLGSPAAKTPAFTVF